MSEELKKCPFCGADPDISVQDYDTEDPYYVVACTNCNMAHSSSDDEDVAIRNWNRPIEDAQAARIAELEKENREQLIDYENRLCEARKYQQDAVRRCEELEAERDRLREALQEIISCQPEMCLARYCCRKCESMAGIARKALKGAENE